MVVPALLSAFYHPLGQVWVNDGRQMYFVDLAVPLEHFNARVIAGVLQHGVDDGGLPQFLTGAPLGCALSDQSPADFLNAQPICIPLPNLLDPWGLFRVKFVSAIPTQVAVLRRLVP